MNGRHRATSDEAQLISALKDFGTACGTAIELVRRGMPARAEWALLRAGRKVALAAGVVFDNHPLGELVYFEPHRPTFADIARDKRARAEGREGVLAPTFSGAACAPGRVHAAPVQAACPVERPTTSAPESDLDLAANVRLPYVRIAGATS